MSANEGFCERFIYPFFLVYIPIGKEALEEHTEVI